MRACVLHRFARSPAWFGFAALAGGLFYGIEKAAVAQGLGLVEGQSDVCDGLVVQHLVKEFAVGTLAVVDIRAERGVQRVRGERKDVVSPSALAR